MANQVKIKVLINQGLRIMAGQTFLIGQEILLLKQKVKSFWPIGQ